MKFIERTNALKHGWEHGSYTVYSVIHGLTDTSNGLQPFLDTSET